MAEPCTAHPGAENHCPTGNCGACWLCHHTPESRPAVVRELILAEVHRQPYASVVVLDRALVQEYLTLTEMATAQLTSTAQPGGETHG